MNGSVASPRMSDINYINDKSICSVLLVTLGHSRFNCVTIHSRYIVRLIHLLQEPVEAACGKKYIMNYSKSS